MPDFSTVIVFGDGIRSFSLCLAFHTILDVFCNSRPQHQEVSDVYALGIQAGGIVLYSLAVDAERRGSAAGPARHFYLG
jgi:hypothetical protein